MMTNLIKFLPSIAFWSVLFGLLTRFLYKILPMPGKLAAIQEQKLRSKLCWEYVTNICSFIHAVCSFFWTNSLMMNQGVRNSAANLETENSMLSFSIGYFLMDSTLGYIYKYNDKSMNIHHAETLISLVYSLAKNKYGSIIVWALWLAEMSNPFNLARKNADCHPNMEKLTFALGLMFSFVFLYTRVFWVGVYLVPVLDGNSSLFMKLHGGLLCEITRASVAVLELRHHQQAGQGSLGSCLNRGLG
jgi:hypothetical protein